MRVRGYEGTRVRGYEGTRVASWKQRDVANDMIIVRLIIVEGLIMPL